MSAAADRRLRDWLIASLNAGIAAGVITSARGGEVLERWDALIDEIRPAGDPSPGHSVKAPAP